MRESESIWLELKKIGELLEELDPSSMHGRIRDLRRGGLPSSSFSDGGRGAETPLPLPDTVDQFLTRQWKTYRHNLSTVLVMMQQATQAQRSVVQVIKDAEKELQQWSCENPACSGLLEPGRRKGECSKCKVHRHRHGLAWPYTEEKTA